MMLSRSNWKCWLECPCNSIYVGVVEVLLCLGRGESICCGRTIRYLYFSSDKRQPSGIAYPSVEKDGLPSWYLRLVDWVLG